MEQIHVIFGRSNKPISVGIRLVTGDEWSHVGAIKECGTKVIEAVGGIGVIETPLPAFIERYDDVLPARLPCRDALYAHEFMRNQLGKDYDYGAFFGIPFRQKWDDPEKWICSEMIGAASQLFRSDAVSSLTPDDIFVLTY